MKHTFLISFLILVFLSFGVSDASALLGDDILKEDKCDFGLKKIDGVCKVVTGVSEEAVKEVTYIVDERKKVEGPLLKALPKVVSEVRALTTVLPTSSITPRVVPSITPTPTVTTTPTERSGQVLSVQDKEEETVQVTPQSTPMEENEVVAASVEDNKPVSSAAMSSFSLGWQFLLLVLLSFVAMGMAVVTPKSFYPIISASTSHKRIALVCGGITALLFILSIKII